MGTRYGCRRIDGGGDARPRSAPPVGRPAPRAHDARALHDLALCSVVGRLRASLVGPRVGPARTTRARDRPGGAPSGRCPAACCPAYAMARRGIKRCARRSLPRRGRALYAGVAAGVGGGLAALAPPRQPRRARGRRPASPPRPGALRRAPSVVPPVGVRLPRGRWRAPLLRSPRPGGPAPSLRPGPRRRVSLPCRGRSAPGSVPGRGSPPRVGSALLSVVGWRRPLHRRGGAGRAGGAP